MLCIAVFFFVLHPFPFRCQMSNCKQISFVTNCARNLALGTESTRICRPIYSYDWTGSSRGFLALNSERFTYFNAYLTWPFRLVYFQKSFSRLSFTSCQVMSEWVVLPKRIVYVHQLPSCWKFWKMLGPDACTLRCSQCQAEIQTGIKTKAGLVPILSGVLICLVG